MKFFQSGRLLLIFLLNVYSLFSMRIVENKMIIDMNPFHTGGTKRVFLVQSYSENLGSVHKYFGGGGLGNWNFFRSNFFDPPFAD